MRTAVGASAVFALIASLRFGQKEVLSTEPRLVRRTNIDTFDLAMASCKLCSSFGSTKVQYNYDLATQHAETHLYQLKIIDDAIDRNQVFGQCFPDFVPVNAEVGTENTGRRKLFALCRDLFGRKSITALHISCKKCDEKIKIIDGKKWLKSTVLIEHACRHLELKIYECHLCARVFKTRSAVSMHLVKTHRLRTTVGHFRSKIDDFVGEISAMIQACFGDKGKKAHSNQVTIRSASKSSIRGRANGSHLAIERQLYCYRLIRKMSDRNGNVQCRLCLIRLRAKRGMIINCVPIREHTYRHLPTPLHRCRLCSGSYSGRTDMGLHLQRVHALPCLKQNYECLADQYHSEILAIMNTCFNNDADSGDDVAIRNLRESQICRKSARSELTVRRQLLCHRLIRKSANAKGRVQCRLCSKEISAKLGNYLTIKGVMDHASLHLGKKLHQCKKCASSFVAHNRIAQHLKKEHALPMRPSYYHCSAVQFHVDIEGILRQCYGNDGQEEEVGQADGQISIKHESKSTSVLPSKLTTQRLGLCIQLTRECSKDNRLQCRLCSNWISVKKPNGIGSSHAMQHALAHLAKPIFRCKICSDIFTTRTGVHHHMKPHHALPATNNYDCLGDQFHTEIVEMLRECYNKDTAISEAETIKNRAMMNEVNVRKSVHGSKQAIERQLYCYRLVRKFATFDGKIECRRCKKQIGAKKGKYYKSKSALMHVLIHLRKPIYRCVVCSEKRPYESLILRHLQKSHALPLTGNYESLADEYDSEILAMLRECYGEL